MAAYTEDHLVERPAIQLMQHELGWEVERNIEHRTPNIERRREEMKMNRTKPALLRLNPDLRMEAIEGVVGEISRNRSTLCLVEANREIDKLLKGGVKVSFPGGERGGQRTDLFELDSAVGCNSLKFKAFLFKWKTSAVLGACFCPVSLPPFNPALAIPIHSK